MLISNLVEKAKARFTQKSCNPTNFMITINFIIFLHKGHFRYTLLCKNMILSSAHHMMSLYIQCTEEDPSKLSVDLLAFVKVALQFTYQKGHTSAIKRAEDRF
jgi:hypothetical protein